jgi:iron(III) transport system substrate-binding protein
VKANGIKVVTSNGEAKDLVASGELAWAFTDTDDASEALEQHKPVAVVYPDQDGLGTLVMPNAVALVKGAPHPEQAKQLIDYLLSRQVEERLAKSTAAQMPLHANVPVPPNVKPASAIKDMAVTFPGIGRAIDQILPYLKQWSGGG